MFIFTSLFTARPSLPEKERAKSDRRRQWFEAKEDGEKLYRFISSESDPAAAVEDWIENMNYVIEKFPKAEHPKLRAEFKMAMFENIQRTLYGIALSDLTAEAKARDMKKAVKTILIKKKK